MHDRVCKPALYQAMVSRWQRHCIAIGLSDSASGSRSGSHARDLSSSHGSPGALSVSFSIKILEKKQRAFRPLL
jgi:hypothetical protein